MRLRSRLLFLSALLATFVLGWNGALRSAHSESPVQLRETFTASITQLSAGGEGACVVRDGSPADLPICSALVRRVGAAPLAVGDHVTVSRQVLRTAPGFDSEVLVVLLPF